jgi:tetratricopeptide (TPR) repeat protein
MKLQEFIARELFGIAESVITRSFSNEQSKILIERAKLLLTGKDIPDYEELLTIIQNDEQLSSLKSFKWHVEQLVKINEYYGNLLDKPSDLFIETDIKNVIELIKSQPVNRLIPFFWIIYNLESFNARESFNREIASFYKEVFEKYGYFIDLDDFLTETDLLNPNYFIENVEEDYFVPVFQKAIDRYPQKLALKKSLAIIFYKNQNYKSSLEIFKSICDQIESKSKILNVIREDYFYNNDFLDTLEYIALNYEKLGETEEVPYYVNYVLENLPSLSSSEGEEPQKDIYSFINSFFLRMRINLRKGEYQKVKEDYQTVKAFMDIDPQHWYDEYGDVLNQMDKI